MDDFCTAEQGKALQKRYMEEQPYWGNDEYWKIWMQSNPMTSIGLDATDHNPAERVLREEAIDLCFEGYNVSAWKEYSQNSMDK